MYEARVICDSITASNHRLTTVVVRLPRFVLAEFNTHRMFSRNSASSRAIPVAKQLEAIEQQPFVPSYWGLQQPGMQADEQIPAELVGQAEQAWLEARDAMVTRAKRLLELGVHKQTVNRLLEPFMWHTIVVTATEWSNFLALRAHKDAQPEIRQAAELIREALAASTPRRLADQEWHLPFLQPDEVGTEFAASTAARQVCAARCARVSYLTHEGLRDPAADMTLYERLVNGGHLSPLEHVARPMSAVELAAGPFLGNFQGWVQLRKLIAHEDDWSQLRPTSA